AGVAKQKQRPSFHFCLGRGGILADRSTVSDSEFVVALDAVEAPARNAAESIVIRVASEVAPADLAATDAGLYRSETVAEWNDKAERVGVFRRAFYGALVIEERRVSDAEKA